MVSLHPPWNGVSVILFLMFSSPSLSIQLLSHWSFSDFFPHFFSSPSMPTQLLSPRNIVLVNFILIFPSASIPI